MSASDLSDLLAVPIPAQAPDNVASSSLESLLLFDSRSYHLESRSVWRVSNDLALLAAYKDVCPYEAEGQKEKRDAWSKIVEAIQLTFEPHMVTNMLRAVSHGSTARRS
jgi:hypothetical protein